MVLKTKLKKKNEGTVIQFPLGFELELDHLEVSFQRRRNDSPHPIMNKAILAGNNHPCTLDAFATIINKKLTSLENKDSPSSTFNQLHAPKRHAMLLNFNKA